MNAEKLTSLVVIKGESNRRVSKNFEGDASFIEICLSRQDNGCSKRFHHWIFVIWTPFACKKDNPTYCLMDKFSGHMMSSSCNKSKDCRREIENIIEGYT